MKKRCVIIAGGDFEVSEKSVIDPSKDYIIAADSGYAVCKKYDIKPDLIVGDFDSYSGELPTDIKTIHLPTHKDDTDLLFAVRCGKANGFSSFAILGGYGSRPDQNYAMYQTLLWIKENIPSSDASAYCNKFFVTVLLDESKKISVGEGKYLSVFSLYKKAEGVTIKNAEYPLCDADITAGFPVGVSNCAKNTVDISVKKGALLIFVLDKKI